MYAREVIVKTKEGKKKYSIPGRWLDRWGVWRCGLSSGADVSEVDFIQVICAHSEPVRRGPGVWGQSPLEGRLGLFRVRVAVRSGGR